MKQFFRRAWLLYYDGFRTMTIGRTLWAIILIKLAIMFLVLKIFFFPAALSGKNEQERAQIVTQELIDRQSTK